MSSSMDGASVVSEGPTSRKYRFKTSFLLLTASYVALFGLIAVIVSFSSPYWYSSYKYTYSHFVRLGLWNFCFDHYKHPSYQYAETFTGCRWVYNPRFQNIRDWLQPGWFIFVQAMMTISMLMSVFALMAISVPIMHFALKYNVVMIAMAFVLEGFAALSGFLGWLVFAIKHDTRSWMMYPNQNYLDWAFYVAVLSSGLHGAAAVLFAYEGRKAYAKRQRFTNLVYNMHPRTPTNGFETVPLKQPLPPGPIHSTDASQKPYGSRGQLAPPAPHHGSGRFPSQHEQTIGSNQSSPYASISRYSQNQGQQHGGGAGYRSKSPPQPPSRPSQQQHRQYQTQHSKQSQFTAV